MLRKIVQDKGWTQEMFAEKINAYLEVNPALKKETKRNPEGLVDQVQIQRILSGTTPLDQRWLTILHDILGVTPNELLGIGDTPKELKELIPELNNPTPKLISYIKSQIQVYKDIEAIKDNETNS